jgi:hypothetical protein
VKIEGGKRRGCGAVMRGMWKNGHPFIRLSEPPMVTVTVTADSLVNVGGRRTGLRWNSCFESDDVLKEYETNSLILKGQIDDYFCWQLLQDLIL